MRTKRRECIMVFVLSLFKKGGTDSTRRLLWPSRFKIYEPKGLWGGATVVLSVNCPSRLLFVAFGDCTSCEKSDR